MANDKAIDRSIEGITIVLIKPNECFRDLPTRERILHFIPPAYRLLEGQFRVKQSTFPSRWWDSWYRSTRPKRTNELPHWRWGFQSQQKGLTNLVVCCINAILIRSNTCTENHTPPYYSIYLNSLFLYIKLSNVPPPIFLYEYGYVRISEHKWHRPTAALW